MRPAIRVQGLSKRYRIGAGDRAAGYQTLREALAAAAAAPWGRLGAGPRRKAPNGHANDFWALDDVAFEIPPGEVTGVIGRNGAGKSTLLKILSRITEPSRGRVEVLGRMGSLLEVGTGFHPELTGRENVYLNGSILGMRRREIARRFDEIVAFAEIERFLDTPVKRYSSGMYVRLAFAVAAHLEPEILLVDEVLAVGDAEFQRKCTNKMSAVGREGRTVLLVSHNMTAVQHLCQRCLLLNRGKLEADGDARSVIAAYNRLAADRGAEADLSAHEGRTSGSVPCMRRVCVGSDGVVLMGGELEVAVAFEADRTLSGVTFGLVVKNGLQAPVFGVNNLSIRSPELDRPARRGTVVCRVPDVPLMPGSYYIDLYLGTRGQVFDVVKDACRFEVEPADVFGTGKLPPSIAGDVFCHATLGLQDGVDAGADL
jgi:lipopolysaccharide transport system ATP-binding protein